MAATTLCVPGIAVLVSWATLGETPTALGLLGGALCLAGVAISRRKPRVVETPAEQVVEQPCESAA
jgi:drug/metabolite transporter (DMT)-like permease